MISVVIPTRNEEKALEKLLRALDRQTYKSKEVIVVDGHSTDGTRTVAKKYGARLIEETGKHRSPANARNIGVAKARGDIIAVFDCDYEVGEKFLEEGAKAFSKETMIVACSHRLAVDTAIEKILASKIAERKDIVHVYPFFARKGFIQKMGNWDSSLGYGEDRELNSNILSYGRKHRGALKQRGPTVSIHLPHTWAELSAQQRWYGRTILHYLRKINNIKEYLSLLKVLYILVPLALLTNPWLLVPAIPVILLSAYRTIEAVAMGNLYGLAILPMDVVMSFPFAYGLIESLFRKERGRD